MPSVEQRKLDVFARGSTRQEIKALENKPEFTVADIGQLMVIGAAKAPKVGIARGAPIHLHWPFAVHGNLRGPPNGFPCCCEVAVLGALSCPVITRSLSPNPSNTSVVVPSLMPVLICAGSALPPRKT